MRRIAFVLGLVAASFGMMAPASAAPVCAGTENTIVLCIDPTGGTLYSDCVYTGGSTCQQVDVPGPTIGCGGRLGVILNCDIT